MTGHYQAAAYAHTPPLRRETSAFLMKACYQRHMLYGWAVALCLISIPTLLISVWPPQPVTVLPPGPGTVDTVSVVWDTRDIIVKPSELVGSFGKLPPTTKGASGLFVDDIEFIADRIEISDGALLGPVGEYGESPYDEDVPIGFGEGNGGTVFVRDTTAYQFNSIEIDRPPVLIAMDQPEYPSTAKRVAMEGKVLLHILVNSEGYVAEVRIESESNPGFGFAESAAWAAKSAVFSPAIANHQPVSCWVAIPVEFEME